MKKCTICSIDGLRLGPGVGLAVLEKCQGCILIEKPKKKKGKGCHFPF